MAQILEDFEKSCENMEQLVENIESQFQEFDELQNHGMK